MCVHLSVKIKTIYKYLKNITVKQFMIYLMTLNGFEIFKNVNDVSFGIKINDLIDWNLWNVIGVVRKLS